MIRAAKRAAGAFRRFFPLTGHLIVSQRRSARRPLRSRCQDRRARPFAGGREGSEAVMRLPRPGHSCPSQRILPLHKGFCCSAVFLNFGKQRFY